MVTQGGAVRLFLADGREVAGIASEDAQGAAGVVLGVIWLDYASASPKAQNLAQARQAVALTPAEFGGAGTVAAPYWLEA